MSTPPMSIRERLHVARVCIEFEFAFMATDEAVEAGEVVSDLIERAAGDLSSLTDYAEVSVRPAAPTYDLPIGACDDDGVYGSRRRAGRYGDRESTWEECVADDRAARAGEVAALPQPAGDDEHRKG